MRDETRQQREAVIHAVAYRLVAERGYAATSMLAIAKEVKASNETLYRWYGDKKGLFQSMVEANAREVRDAFVEALEANADPAGNLSKVAPVLLTMLLSEQAITLNRAAAADLTGELGAAIGAGGRDNIAPLIVDLMRRGMDDGSLHAPSPEAAGEWFLSLLIGDLQIRRANRRLPEPNQAFVRERCASAMAAFLRLASS